MIPLANLKRTLTKAFEQPLYALKMFFIRGIDYLFYRSGSGRSFLPEAVTIFLTYLCNLRCKMCGQWGEEGACRDFSKEEVSSQLDFTQIKKFIDEVCFYRPSITLFGGEPLLYKDFKQTFSYIKQKKLHCVLITNTSILKEYAPLLVELGLDELNISVDGPQEIHDQIRGIPGLFKQIEENIAYLNQCKERLNKKKPFIHIEFTITKFNVDYMLEMLGVARQFKATSLSFHHLIFLSNKLYAEHEQVFSGIFNASSRWWKGFVLEDSGIDTTKLTENINKLQKIKIKDLQIDVYPNIKGSEISDYYHNLSFIPSGYNKRCLSPWFTCYIFPDGSVRPCLDMEHKAGNVKDEKFLKIWNSLEFINYRRVLKQKKLFPACVRCSELYRY
ncbi:MAG: radical SAM protein [Candidatus Omnitrophica bacterium]|nr:radical SAM protein [Candidatus Omnitrophota bacterium]